MSGGRGGGGGAAGATEQDARMMARALELAREAMGMGEVPVGAVVYETATGVVVGEGFNRRETDRRPWAHAEYLAVQTAAGVVGDWRLNEYSVAVTLEPCVMCAGLMVNARLGRVVFGALDGKAGGVRSLYRVLEDARLNHRCEVVEGLGGEESAGLLREFFRGLRGG